jgi:hypothetical protein
MCCVNGPSVLPGECNKNRDSLGSAGKENRHNVLRESNDSMPRQRPENRCKPLLCWSFFSYSYSLTESAFPWRHPRAILSRRKQRASNNRRRSAYIKSGLPSFSLMGGPHAPKLDGSLNDALWKSAKVITDFRQQEPYAICQHRRNQSPTGAQSALRCKVDLILSHPDPALNYMQKDFPCIPNSRVQGTMN